MIVPHTIRRAAIDDAAALSHLGATTFRETFAGENTPEDMARYLAEAFTPEMIERAGKERLAPMLMTALTAGIALVPLVLAA